MSVLAAMGPLGLATIVQNDPAGRENFTVVAAIADKRIRSLCAVISSATGSVVSFHQGGATASGVLIIPANGTLIIPPSVFGWGDTDVGSPLLLNCDGQISGFVRYQTID